MLAYCDYIANELRRGLLEDQAGILADVAPVRWDLDERGAFRSTTKTVSVTDWHGKRYRITVEEV